MSPKEQLIEIAGNAKAALVVSAVTTGTGVSTLSWIPDDIGKLAMLVGIILSLVLIRAHLAITRNAEADREKTRLETEIMRRKEADRVQSLERRS